MKNILIFTNAIGGLYNFRRELVQRLLDNGHKVAIAAPNDSWKTRFIDLGCVFLETPVERRGVNPVVDLKLIRTYINIIKSSKPDVILTYTIKPNIYGGIAAQLTRTPYISNITGMGSAMVGNRVLRQMAAMLYALSQKKASCTFFQNVANQEYMKNEKIVTGRSRLIPGSGVNLDKFPFSDYPPNEGKINILFVGRIMKEKGIDELLAVIPKIKGKYNFVNFTLIGSKDEGYTRTIQDYQDRGLLAYPGRQDDVHAFIVKHHVVINPSYHEGMANVLLEAASTGRPVLASNVPGCSETFDEEISGLGFKVKDVDDMEKVISKFIELPYEEKKRMGLAGRQKMEREFDRNIVIDAYLEEIQKAMEATQ